jgi:hypothetical protein
MKLTLIFMDGSKSASVEVADNWYHESLVRKLSRIHTLCMDMMKRGNIKTFRYEI